MVPADVTGADLAGLEFGKLALGEQPVRCAAAACASRPPCPTTPRPCSSSSPQRGPRVPRRLHEFPTLITRYNRSQLYASAVTTWPKHSLPVALAPAPRRRLHSVSSANEHGTGRRTHRHQRRHSAHDTIQRHLRRHARRTRPRPHGLLREARNPRSPPHPPPSLRPRRRRRSRRRRTQGPHYVVIDHDSGRVLAALDPDSRQEPASLTKVMTAYGVSPRAQGKDASSSTTWSRSASTPGSRRFADVRRGRQAGVDVEPDQGMIVQSATTPRSRSPSTSAAPRRRSCR